MGLLKRALAGAGLSVALVVGAGACVNLLQLGGTYEDAGNASSALCQRFDALCSDVPAADLAFGGSPCDATLAGWLGTEGLADLQTCFTATSCSALLECLLNDGHLPFPDAGAPDGGPCLDVCPVAGPCAPWLCAPGETCGGPPDAGADASTDAGADAGTDAGANAAVDAGGAMYCQPAAP